MKEIILPDESLSYASSLVDPLQLDWIRAFTQSGPGIFMLLKISFTKPIFSHNE